MKIVSRGRNPHIVNLVGCVTIQEPLSIITEHAKHGDLLSYMNTIRNTVSKFSHFSHACARLNNRQHKSCEIYLLLLRDTKDCIDETHIITKM